MCPHPQQKVGSLKRPGKEEFSEWMSLTLAQKVNGVFAHLHRALLDDNWLKVA